MVGAAIRFVRMPWLLILIWVIARFSLGLGGVPYAPRGNAMFSVLGVSIISCLYFGALSKHRFDWKGTIVVGIAIGFFAQVLIFFATLISYLGGLQTYFVHWDALNVPEGTVVPMGAAMAARAGGLLIGIILPSIVALIGRALGRLAPR
jgi:MFS-type transporter involved in bile tolerance (Atg22 family)